MHMQNEPQETIVISVGGSLIVPDQIDTHFLKKFKELIETATTEGRCCIIICGGGKTARRYQEAAEKVSELDPEDVDWLGIHATQLNAHLMRTIFRDIAHPVLIKNPEEVLEVPRSTPLIIAAGYRPGSSTDLRAVQIAHHRNAKTVINLSNIDHVYTTDPKQDPSAEKIEDITWSEFRKLIPGEWDPGLSSPFDPIAAREAENEGIEVANINGAKLEELKNYLDGKNFIGTRIHS